MNWEIAINRTREVIRRQHKALSTEESYLYWLRRYMTDLNKMPQGLSSEKKLERFLNDLAHRDVSASSQNQAFNAIVFFYNQVLEKPLGSVQLAMGHKSLETTMRYLLAEALSAGSPPEMAQTGDIQSEEKPG